MDEAGCMEVLGQVGIFLIEELTQIPEAFKVGTIICVGEYQEMFQHHFKFYFHSDKSSSSNHFNYRQNSPQSDSPLDRFPVELCSPLNGGKTSSARGLSLQ
jgi:hypothetical protein